MVLLLLTMLRGQFARSQCHAFSMTQIVPVLEKSFRCNLLLWPLFAECRFSNVCILCAGLLGKAGGCLLCLS